MQGAREFAQMFETGQHDRLYLVSGEHARGKTFQIFVLPEGEKAIANGRNAPRNPDAVEVYGIVSGQPGWTESYGWLHEGKWCEDFRQLVAKRAQEIDVQKRKRDAEIAAEESAKNERTKRLLSTY